MIPNIADPVVVLALRLVVIGLFVASVGHKLRGFRKFRRHLEDYRVLPTIATPIAAVVLLSIELVTIAALIIPKTAHLGALLAGALLLVYAAAMLVNLLRGRSSIDCGCGGPGRGQPISYGLVGRNLVLIGIALLAAGPIDYRAMSAWDWALCIAASLTISLIYLVFNQLIANRSRLRPLGTLR